MCTTDIIKTGIVHMTHSFKKRELRCYYPFGSNTVSKEWITPLDW